MRVRLAVRLAQRLRAAPYAAPVLGVLAVAAYLCLANLDYAALWHDEAPAALIGRNLLQWRDITGWDGRNLVGGTNGRTLNRHLRDVLPPLTYVLNAAGMAVFGVDQTGARIVHALLGVLSLGLLYLLLRQHPRLILFCLLFAAWSPQLLLYFRQSRYFAFMACGVIAAFYLYERWWRSGRAAYLVALTLVALLAFFNHYNGGAATMLALAAWHLLRRSRATAPRQWLALSAAGMVVVAAGTAYLAWLGVLGGERSGWTAFAGFAGFDAYRETPASLPLRVLPRIAIYTRELFTADWISWPVFLWFAGLLLWIFLRRRARRSPPGEARDATGKGSGRSAAGAGDVRAARNMQMTPGGDLPVAAVAGIVLLGALFALFALFSAVQPVWRLIDPRADLRYYLGAHYPTQRPEINAHAFTPLPAGSAAGRSCGGAPGTSCARRRTRCCGRSASQRRWPPTARRWRPTPATRRRRPAWAGRCSAWGATRRRWKHWRRRLPCSRIPRKPGRCGGSWAGRRWSWAVSRRRPDTSRARCDSTRAPRRRSTTWPWCASASSGTPRRWSCTRGCSRSPPTRRRFTPTGEPRCTTWAGSTRQSAASSAPCPWTRRWKWPAAPWRRSASPIRGPARSRALRARSTSARDPE